MLANVAVFSRFKLLATNSLNKCAHLVRGFGNFYPIDDDLFGLSDEQMQVPN